ncbi:GntR family transcriptional regulator [Aquabacterium sp.]|uniref:GntR family transcriptional regulator n=1 Tax=Aquabacterium sp. TaxID=1872578 RepID=UPI003B6DFA83
MMSEARKTPANKETSPRANKRLRKVDADAIPAEPIVGGDDTSSTEQIVLAVTRAIVEHRLEPGTKLVEQSLGDRFGVSRTIVRQALFRLSELKLVKLEPARGAFVAAPSMQEAREVFAVRRMVEGQMLRELVQRIRPADIKQLKTHIAEERDAVTRIDVPTRTKLLFDFHVKMAQVLGNQVLVDLMQELVSRCSLISLMYQSADDAETSNAEHVDILSAIETKDADLAVKLLNEHLDTVEKQLTEHRRTAPASRATR